MSIRARPRGKEFHDLIARDAARWKAVATKANIKLD